MRFPGLLHHHPAQRIRQFRWVVPLAVLVLVAVLTVLVVQYRLSDQAVGTEFFRAHKTISHTGELLRRGLVIGGAVLVGLVLAIAVWAFRLTHRIVRPVHTLHRTLDALVAGDLGVRVALHPGDEFHETAEALNRLVNEFATTLARVHALVDGIASLAAAVTCTAREDSPEAQLQALVEELDRTMEFFRLEPSRTISEDD